MTQTAKLFITGRSQAVRLPKEFRFEGKEVSIRRDPVNGDVILSKRHKSWDDFFALLEKTKFPADFLTPEDRDLDYSDRDPFASYKE